jgi:hypothetical protein
MWISTHCLNDGLFLSSIISALTIAFLCKKIHQGNPKTETSSNENLCIENQMHTRWQETAVSGSDAIQCYLTLYGRVDKTSLLSENYS